MSVRNPIPEGYELRKIVEALIDELEKNILLLNVCPCNNI
jgi:hypothetical protein